jgi:hypothetical protein
MAPHSFEKAIPIPAQESGAHHYVKTTDTPWIFALLLRWF